MAANAHSDSQDRPDPIPSPAHPHWSVEAGRQPEAHGGHTRLTTPLTWHRYGPNAILLHFASEPDESAFQCGQRLQDLLKSASWDGLKEVVPAFTTCLLVFEDWAGGSLEAQVLDLVRHWNQLPHLPQLTKDFEQEPVMVPVVYDGPDLDRVAEWHGLSREAVCEIHAAADYRIHCLGFAPGFPYLGGLPPTLHTPRLDTPRPRIPAGSVAIGGEHTGIYPLASPGGWNLIGRTAFRLFRPEAVQIESVFPLRAGQHLRFVRMAPGEVPELDPAVSHWFDTNSTHAHWDPSGFREILRIHQVGAGLSIQDEGRPGWRRFGVPSGGYLDNHAARWANRLLQNPTHAPVLEMAGMGQDLEILEDGWMAVAGAAKISSSRGHMHAWEAFRVTAGERLKVVPGKGGVWTYLAVPHGFHTSNLLGSASMHSRFHIGGLLEEGTVLRHSSAPTFDWPESVAARRVSWTDTTEYWETPVIRIWPAPQTKLFPEQALELLSRGPWEVSHLIDRVGYRLEGPRIDTPPEPMISEPVLPGTIQVPTNGQPIITMADGPTLGGYPKLGLVHPYDLPRLAQVRPGAQVQFRWI